MKNAWTDLPGWNAQWKAAGPVSRKRQESFEKHFFHAGLGTSLKKMPEMLEICGKPYPVITIPAVGGVIDFTRIAGGCKDGSAFYIIADFQERKKRRTPFSFGADQSTVFWLNGLEVYETSTCFLDPENIASHQFVAPVVKGTNRLVVRIAGSSSGWSIRISKPAFPPGYAEMPGRHSVKNPETGIRRLITRDYAGTCLRLEHRPRPDPVDTTSRRARIMAAHGIGAHWIGIVDQTGSPYGRSEFLPPGENSSKENEAWLKEQVKCAHRSGIAVMTWFPGSVCKSAARKNPGWRVRYLKAEGLEDRWRVCVNSPYGRALNSFVCESIKKYGLDGFWFDGTLWTMPGNIGCACEYCRRLYSDEEGIDFPETADWKSESFRRWVKWRYASYMKFWGTLAAQVRRRFPNVRIILNHPRRMPYWSFPGPYPIESWLCGMPADCYEGDVMAGSETVDTSFESAFHSRLARAYGKPYSEVWTGLHWISYRGKNWPGAFDPANRFIHHAMACLTAGAVPSFGTPDKPEEITDTFDRLFAIISPRCKYMEGPTEKYVALHLSQQSETFHFSATEKPGFPHAYWKSLFGWHNLLCEKQMLVDIIFDSAFRLENLSAYPVVITPLSVCLSNRQVADILEYVSNGGVLATGSCLGTSDEWGNHVNRGDIGKLIGRNLFSPDCTGESQAKKISCTIRKLGRGKVIIFRGDPGYWFAVNGNRNLADRIGRVIRNAAKPHVSIKGPRRIHIGLFKNGSSLFLHLHNSMAYSESRRFPNPLLMTPEPAENVKVRIEGYPVSAVHRTLLPGSPSVRTKRLSDRIVEFVIPRISWGDIVEIDL